jgi:hypothetical protein
MSLIAQIGRWGASAGYDRYLAAARSPSTLYGGVGPLPGYYKSEFYVFSRTLCPHF